MNFKLTQKVVLMLVLFEFLEAVVTTAFLGYVQILLHTIFIYNYIYNIFALSTDIHTLIQKEDLFSTITLS